MRRLYSTIAAFAFLAGATFVKCGFANGGTWDIYNGAVRTPLFSAFITLGSFLLTLKTTILQRLKDGYDSSMEADAYRATFETFEDNPSKRPPYYQNLGEFSRTISLAVFMSLTTAVIQMTLGFVKHWLALAVCVAFPITTMGVILFLWWRITGAHRVWLHAIETDRAGKLKKYYDDVDAERSRKNLELEGGNETARTHIDPKEVERTPPAESTNVPEPQRTTKKSPK